MEVLTLIGTAVVSGAAGAVGREMICRRNGTRKVCSSHVYIEKKIMFHDNYMRWMGGLLYRICQKLEINPPPEPKEN